MTDKALRGELTACGWSFSENGMSMYSHAESSMDLKRTASGEWQLTDRTQKDLEGETVSVYRVDPEVPRKIAALSDREDMPSWESLKEETDPRFQMTDYSSSSYMTLEFARKGTAGHGSLRYSINAKAARSHGHEAAVSEFVELLKGCRKPEKLISTKKKGPSPKIPNILGGGPKPPGGTQAGRVCPECGYAGVEGKFCPECGARMPE